MQGDARTFSRDFLIPPEHLRGGRVAPNVPVGPEPTATRLAPAQVIMKTITLFTALWMSTLPACGDDGGGTGQTFVKPDGSSCGDGGRSGVTQCTASANGECQAGQYCNSQELTCSVGCTSDNNCAGNQYCDTAGGVGTCKACTAQTTSSGDSSCDNAGKSLRACGVSAVDTSAFVTACEDFMADEEFRELAELTLDCIELAGDDCEEQSTCISDEGGDPGSDENFGE
jgi:hypothetical protein